MKNKLIYFFGVCLFFLVPTVNAHADPAYQVPDAATIKQFVKCLDDQNNDQIKDASNYNDFRAYLDQNKITYSETKLMKESDGSYKPVILTVARNPFVRDCVVSYGDQSNFAGTAWAKDESPCQNPYYPHGGISYTQYRYFGFYADGNYWRPYPNPYFCDVGGQQENYLLDNKFLSHPWMSPTYDGIRAQAKNGGTIAVPDTTQRSTTDKTRLEMLRTAIDRWYIFKYPNANPIGNFDEYNPYNKTTFIQGSPTNSSDATYALTPLTNYADITSEPGYYYGGVFNMYMHISSGQFAGYWVSSYFMPPSFVPYCDTCGDTSSAPTDLQLDSLTINPAPSQERGTAISSITAKVENTGKTTIDESSDLRLRFNVDGNTDQEVCVTYDMNSRDNRSLAPGQWNAYTFSNFYNCDTGKMVSLHYPNITNSSQKVTLYGNINYSQKSPKNETNWNNNIVNQPVTVTSHQNAKVSISRKKSQFDPNTDFSIPFYVSNDMYSTIEAPCSSADTPCASGTTKKTVTYTVTDTSANKVVTSGTMTYKINAGSDNQPFNIKLNLPFGFYKISVQIPEYANESSYTDNVDTLAFTIQPVFPDNTDCKFLNVPGMININSVKNVNGVAKMCVGSVPNHPSTTVEGGQKTYFLVEYVFLPSPLPSYKVQTLDTHGAQQILTLNEDNVSAGNENDYIYYPTKIGQVAGLNGPFTAGPHSFYHYMYRGRMFAKDVTFNFNVQDPKGNSLAIGNIHYTIPAYCYDPVNLDFRDGVDPVTGQNYQQCRKIYFYLPNTQTNLTQMGIEPTDNVKLSFKNPGIHTFQFTASENQAYRYQTDQGNEVQGKAGVPMGSGYTAPYNLPKSMWTTTAPTGEIKYVPADSLLNHCETLTDPFGNTTATNCIHDNNKDFQYWRFAYSAPNWLP